MSKYPLEIFMLALGVRVPDEGRSEDALFSLLYEATHRDWPHAKGTWKTGGWAALALIFGVKITLITQTKLPDAIMKRADPSPRPRSTQPRANIRGEATSPNPWLCKDDSEIFLPDGESFLEVTIKKSANDTYRIHDDPMNSDYDNRILVVAGPRWEYEMRADPAGYVEKLFTGADTFQEEGEPDEYTEVVRKRSRNGISGKKMKRHSPAKLRESQRHAQASPERRPTVHIDSVAMVPTQQQSRPFAKAAVADLEIDSLYAPVKWPGLPAPVERSRSVQSEEQSDFYEECGSETETELETTFGPATAKWHRFSEPEQIQPPQRTQTPDRRSTPQKEVPLRHIFDQIPTPPTESRMSSGRSINPFMTGLEHTRFIHAAATPFPFLKSWAPETVEEFIEGARRWVKLSRIDAPDPWSQMEETVLNQIEILWEHLHRRPIMECSSIESWLRDLETLANHYFKNGGRIVRLQLSRRANSKECCCRDFRTIS